MKPRSIVLLALLWGLTGTAAAVGNLADVTVYDRAEQRTLPVYHHEGRYYVVGKPGSEYQIRVRNRTGGEILSVVSVDGVNAVSGETANWHQTGYVLAPHQTLEVKGWRKSLARVAAFFFTEHQNSYAARTGRPENVGVIGVALFRKKAEPEAQIDQTPARRESSGAGAAENSPFPRSAEPESGAGAASPARSRAADGAPRYAPSPPPQGGSGKVTEDSTSAARAPSRSTLRESESGAHPFEKSSSLGTGHGRSETSHARYTSFERATPDPEEVIAIHYDTYRNLVAMGVIKAPRLATPFPGQFVPDPR